MVLGKHESRNHVYYIKHGYGLAILLTQVCKVERRPTQTPRMPIGPEPLAASAVQVLDSVPQRSEHSNLP